MEKADLFKFKIEALAVIGVGIKYKKYSLSWWMCIFLI